MDELITWLRAQLDEDERVARGATAGPWRYDPTKHHRRPGTSIFEEGVFTGPPGAEAVCIAVTGETDDTQSMADAEHIARWDPARVLAEIAAKRAILDSITSRLDHREPDGGWEDADAETDGMASGTLHLLAQPYAGHEGWREEWAA